MPRRQNSVLFISFKGQYSDNPKYVLLKLHEIYPQARIYLAISDRHSGMENIPDYVLPVHTKSLKFKFLLCRCHVCVDNMAGLQIPDMLIFRYIKKILAINSQLIISTWHGTPLKKLLRDSLDWNSSNSLFLHDFLIAGNKYTALKLSACCQKIPIKISLTGTPRNDILFNNHDKTKILKSKLRLPHNKKIILFAPTFREDTYESGIYQMEILNIYSIIDACSQYLAGNYIFVYRLHQLVLLTIDLSRYQSPVIFNGNIGDDMAEYLACTDILITDYSSSMFDFALTGKPCFLFAPDREHYEKKERGFYLDYDSLPFPISYTNEELIKNIQEFDDVAYRERVSRFLEEIGNVEDGKASERIAECIVHFLRTGEKRLRTIDDYNGQGEY